MSIQAGRTLEWLSFIRRDNHSAALIFSPQHVLSYDDLARHAESFAQCFGETKKLIAIEGRNSEHSIIAYLAALMSGHAVALLPPGRPGMLEEFCQQFDPHFIYRVRDGRWRLEEREDARAQLHPDLALLLSTSGSEGRAKWVRLSAANLAANARSIQTYLGLREDDVAALSLPMHYSYGLSIVNSHFAAGAAVSVICKSIIDDGWRDDVVSTGCTNISGVPYSYELLEQICFRKHRLDNLRFMTCAGGRLSPDLVRKYADYMSDAGGQFFAMYGQTEATARIAYLPPERARDYPDCIGVAIPGGELCLIDEQGKRIASVGEVGELVYNGPNVMMGYAATADDLRRGSELSSLRTGDLAERTEAGLYRITGRRKRFSKIAGIRIDHAALEEACRERGVAAAIIGDDSRLAVFHASLHRDAEVMDLVSRAAGLPARYFDVTHLTELPRLETGKIDYQTLRAEAGKAKTRAADHSVLDVFHRHFHARPVSPSDTFRSLGGDSLAYVQLALDLEQTIKGPLPPDWDRRTIAELSKPAERPTAAYIETSILLRALAILMVVIHHATLWPVPAGATILLMLAGYGIGRFHAATLLAGDTITFVKSVLAKLLPYYLILLGFTLAGGQVPWASVFLVGNLGFGHPDDHTLMPFLYWFVEAYVQIMLLVAMLFSFRRIRTLVARRPFETGMVALFICVVLRIATPVVLGLEQRVGFNPTWLLFLIPLGWCAYFVQSQRQKVVLAAAALAVMAIVATHGGNWIGSWIRYGVTALALLLLVFRLQIRLPSYLIWPALTVSAASFHIYLVHRLVPEAFGSDVMANALSDTFIGLAGGIGVFYLHKICRNLSLRWLGSKPLVTARS